ncbi:MAG: hypothetical protein JSW71_21960 [Gemmatimonadota bacterium]|nr:MAG: hypothetical protein JSW71_21960 [Gemmatimonadota bacterium]
MTVDAPNADGPVNSAVFLTESEGAGAEIAAALQGGAAFARVPDSLIELTGPAALQCLQGLVTCDLEEPGGETIQYSALLTPKGMIVSDMWIARGSSRLTLYVPPQGKVRLLEVFERSLPPRLARFAIRSGSRSILRVVGPHAIDVVTEAGLPVPRARNLSEYEECCVARPADDRPFVIQIDCPTEQAERLALLLARAGALESSGAALGLARILAGWPSLEAEIDARTLPQEVRFDELEAVSHSKGCYVGQETVARLHFRGHVNKRVVGLRFAAEPDTGRSSVTCNERPVGRVTSAGWFGADRGYLGLAMIRREVAVGDEVIAAGVAATTVSLPFEFGA